MSVTVTSTSHPPSTSAVHLESKQAATKFTAQASTSTATAAARAPGNTKLYSEYENAFCPLYPTTTNNPVTTSDICSMAFAVQTNGSDSCSGKFFMPASKVPGNDFRNIKVCGQSSNRDEPCVPPGQELNFIYCDPNVIGNIGGVSSKNVPIVPGYVAVPKSVADYMGNERIQSGCYSSQSSNAPTPVGHATAYVKSSSTIAQTQLSAARITG